MIAVHGIFDLADVVGLMSTCLLRLNHDFDETGSMVLSVSS